MTEVEGYIHQFDNAQREIMLFFHHLLTNDYSLTSKITFKNPCYYGNSWICYLKALKNDKIELAFMRGNELSNDQGLLMSKGRKQLRSIDFSDVKEIPIEMIREVFQEALLLDEVKPYESKRKSKRS